MRFLPPSTLALKLQARIKIHQKMLFRMLPFFCLIGIAFSVTAQFFKLNVLPITPADDLARHVAMAENFLIALKSGQFWPIIQEPSLADLPDMPLFQYYGFMTGLAALPGMLLSLSSLKALMIGVFIFRIAGAVGVYWASSLLGGNRKVSILASIVYYMTPYVISNLYGRVAVPETLAHCELPFLVVGLLLGLRGSLPAGAVTIAVTILLLSLTHPIFLLYGCIALVMMMLVSLSRRVIVTGSIGLLAGTLLSAFHWYPMYLTRSYLSRFTNFLSPTASASLTSWRGLWGFPKSLAELSGAVHSPFGTSSLSSLDYLYLTPGWFTLPVILALAFLITVRGKLPEKLIILIPNIVFLFLAFSLGDIYQFLPAVTWTVQFPYRLLAFVALFTALGLPLLLPRLKTAGFLILAFMAIYQSSALIFHLSYREPLLVAPEAIARTYANYDYSIVDKNAINEGDNWMFYYAKRFYPTVSTQGLSAPITSDDLIPVLLSPANQQYIHIEGIASSSSRVIQAWLEDPHNPEIKSNVQKISPGSFSMMFSLPAPNKIYRLVTHPKLSSSDAGEGTIIRVKLTEGLPFHYLNYSFKKPAELRLSGRSIFTDQAIEIWFAKPSAPLIPVTGKVRVGPGSFHVSLPYPNDASDYILVPSKTHIPAKDKLGSSDERRLSLDLKYADVVPKDMPDLQRITYEFVDTKKSGGYSRLYSIRSGAWWTPDGKTNYPGTVELPLAYSPFYVFTQDGHRLTARPDEKARTNVLTNNLATEISARYRLPSICYLALLAGLAVLMGFTAYCRRIKKNFN